MEEVKLKGWGYYKAVTYTQLLLLSVKFTLYPLSWVGFEPFRLSWLVTLSPVILVVIIYLIFLALCFLLVKIKSSK
jgi:hypothetical protein